MRKALLIPILLLFLPIAKSVTLPYWVSGGLDKTTELPEGDPNSLSTTHYISYPNSFVISDDNPENTGGFVNQSFKYTNCNRLNISYHACASMSGWMKCSTSGNTCKHQIRTKNSSTIMLLDCCIGSLYCPEYGLPNQKYYSIIVPYNITSQDFVMFYNYAPPITSKKFIDDVYIFCEDPYSPDNWIDNEGFDLLNVTTTTTTTTTTIPTTTTTAPTCVIVGCGDFPPDSKTNFLSLQLCHFTNWYLCHPFVVMVSIFILTGIYLIKKTKNLFG